MIKTQCRKCLSEMVRREIEQAWGYTYWYECPSCGEKTNLSIGGRWVEEQRHKIGMDGLADPRSHDHEE